MGAAPPRSAGSQHRESPPAAYACVVRTIRAPARSGLRTRSHRNDGDDDFTTSFAATDYRRYGSVEGQRVQRAQLRITDPPDGPTNAAACASRSNHVRPFGVVNGSGPATSGAVQQSDGADGASRHGCR
jgi:hypothetical protein